MLLAISMTFTPVKGSMALALRVVAQRRSATGKIRGALFEKVCNALAKIFGLAATLLLAVGDLGGLGQRLEQAFVDLPLDDADRSGRGEIGKFEGALVHGLGEALPRQDAHQPQALGLFSLHD